MKRLIACLIFLTSFLTSASESNVVERHEEIKSKKTFKYELELDNKAILDATCFESKVFGPTSYSIDGTSFDKSVTISAVMGDGRIETGVLSSNMKVLVKRDSEEGNKFCDKVNICSELATVTLPVWVIPVVIGVTIRDISRTNKNGKFLKSYLNDLEIPECKKD